MNEERIRAQVMNALWSLAPEAEGQPLAGDEDLREALDLDSMDFLGLVTALHDTLGVDIPQTDYPRIATLDGLVGYLAQKLT